MNSRILVTGGAGYLGSVLVPALVEQGNSVTVVDNFSHGVPSLAGLCSRPDFDIVRGDVRDMSVMEPLIAKSDVVIPLAALVGAPMCDRDQIGAESINRDAIANLTKRMSIEQMLVMPVTNSGYGVGEGTSLCTEESPLRPLTLYGRTKVEAESIVMARENSISLRLATVFGMSPRMRMDLLVNDFVFRAVRDRFVVVFEGHFKRNYIHIRDVAGAFLHSLRKFDSMKGQIYNVGLSDANLSKLELCGRIQSIIPKFVFLEAPVGEDPDKRDYIVSNAKIEGTGYKPEYSLESGIRELVKGYRMVRTTLFGNV